MVDDDSISIMLAGDFCPAGAVESRFRAGTVTAEGLLSSLSELLCRSDISSVNLECPLTEATERIDKPSAHIRAHPDMVELLRFLCVKVVTLANNHVRDYGERGVLDTLKICEKNGIATVGAGATHMEARKPLIVSAKGRRVAFLNAAEQEFSNAGPTRAGANPLDLVDMVRDLHAVRRLADHVVLILHGGLEMTHYPSPESVKLMRFLAEQGATAVIRHHAHVVQGCEVWKNVPICYGLGNLLFDLPTRVNDGWYQGVVVELTVTHEDRCSARLHPIRQCDGDLGVKVLADSARAQALESVEKYSELLADERCLASAWDSTLAPLREDYFGKLLVPSNLLRRVLRRLGLTRWVYPRGWSKQYWENILRCDTHREALLSLLASEDEF
jgi:poly-gamma-glutamate synthesis protein (capsule biosynthesis protein)